MPSRVFRWVAYLSAATCGPSAESHPHRRSTIRWSTEVSVREQVDPNECAPRTGSRVRVGGEATAQHGRPSGRLWVPAMRKPHAVATRPACFAGPVGRLRPILWTPRPSVGFGARQVLRTTPELCSGLLRSHPCACTPDFAGFARLGSALGPGESPRERQPFGRALRNPPKWAAAISSGCLRIRFQSSCRFPYSYRVTTSFELPYTDSRNPPYLRMY